MSEETEAPRIWPSQQCPQREGEWGLTLYRCAAAPLHRSLTVDHCLTPAATPDETERAGPDIYLNALEKIKPGQVYVHGDCNVRSQPRHCFGTTSKTSSTPQTRVASCAHRVLAYRAVRVFIIDNYWAIILYYGR